MFSGLERVHSYKLNNQSPSPTSSVRTVNIRKNKIFYIAKSREYLCLFEWFWTEISSNFLGNQLVTEIASTIIYFQSSKTKTGNSFKNS